MIPDQASASVACAHGFHHDCPVWRDECACTCHGDATACRMCGAVTTPAQRADHRARTSRDAARAYVTWCRTNNRTPNPHIEARANQEDQ